MNITLLNNSAGFLGNHGSPNVENRVGVLNYSTDEPPSGNWTWADLDSYPWCDEPIYLPLHPSLIVLSAIAILSNCTILAVFVKDRKKYHISKLHIQLIALAVNDFAIAFTMFCHQLLIKVLAPKYKFDYDQYDDAYNKTYAYCIRMQ